MMRTQDGQEAAQVPPLHLTTIVPANTASGYESRTAVRQLAQGSLDIAPYFSVSIAHRTDGSYWQRWAFLRHNSEITILAWHIER